MKSPPSSKATTLAELTRRRRVELDVSQAAVAGACGLHVATVSDIENGRGMLAAWRVRRFAEVLAVGVDVVLAAIEETHRRGGVKR